MHLIKVSASQTCAYITMRVTHQPPYGWKNTSRPAAAAATQGEWALSVHPSVCESGLQGCAAPVKLFYVALQLLLLLLLLQ